MRRALRSAQDPGLVWFNLAVCLREKGDADAAVEAYQRAIRHDPGMSVAHEQLGKLLYREGRAEDAAEVYRLWHLSDPCHPVATHMAGATGSAPPSARASDEFVRAIFDHAADEFDAALARIDYQVPRLLHECVTRTVDADVGGCWDILDLGCGTGLCGELFRTNARRMVGVDLSQGMLSHAHRRAVYDELHCRELSTYLDSCAEKFDVVLAADVFCYFGDLRALLMKAVPVLRPTARILFSVEDLTDESSGQEFVLREHGRYAHSAAHIGGALSEAGMEFVDLGKAALRFERGAPVDGLIVAARLARLDA